MPKDHSSLNEAERALVSRDSRRRIYEVSPGGRRVVDKLVAARYRGLAELLDGWSPEQHEEVARLLLLADELFGGEPVLAGSAGASRGGRR